MLLTVAMLLAPVAVQARSDAQEQGETPSLELLEFLGFWETPDGELIDPLNLAPPKKSGEPDDEARPQEKGKVKSHE